MIMHFSEGPRLRKINPPRIEPELPLWVDFKVDFILFYTMRQVSRDANGGKSHFPQPECEGKVSGLILVLKTCRWLSSRVCIALLLRVLFGWYLRMNWRRIPHGSWFPVWQSGSCCAMSWTWFYSSENNAGFFSHLRCWIYVGIHLAQILVPVFGSALCFQEVENQHKPTTSSVSDVCCSSHPSLFCMNCLASCTCPRYVCTSENSSMVHLRSNPLDLFSSPFPDPYMIPSTRCGKVTAFPFNCWFTLTSITNGRVNIRETMHTATPPSW